MRTGPQRVSIYVRALLVLSQMTLDEKISFVSNPGTGVSHEAIPPLCIPAATAIHGALGAHVQQPSTAMPSTLGLAASGDLQLGARYGDVLGSETWTSGNQLILAPVADLMRVPQYGRAAEAMSEDPLLTGLMAAADVQGIQRNPVISVLKHYATNNQETNRKLGNATVDERTLQEMYLRSWGTIVNDGQPGGMMCAFTATNGQFSCGNKYLLTDVLKGQYGFKGYVQSDFNAAHSTLDANAGLDLEDPSTIWFGSKLKAAVLAGTVPLSRLNDMVFHILRSYFQNGVIDHPSPTAQIPSSMLDTHYQTARAVADEGSVLLKNDGTLPLSTGGLNSIAVIDGDANYMIQSSGSAEIPDPARVTTVLQGIAARAGSGVTVNYAPGVDPVTTGDMLPGPAPVPSSILTPAGGAAGQHGLLAEYWPDPSQSGNPTTVRTDLQVDLETGVMTLNDASQQPAAPGTFGPISARWTGTLTAPATGTYQFSLSHYGTATLTLNGITVINNPGVPPQGQDAAVTTANVNLVAGQFYSVVINYREDQPVPALGNAPVNRLRFNWIPPANALSPAMQRAVDAAARSQVAIVVADTFTSEGADRAGLTLPQGYDRLINAVARANQHTIVVLATAGPVTTPWLNNVAGVLEAWYPGEAQGTAVADLLFGDVNPSGKLPITFPLSDRYQPISTVAQWPGVNGNPVYSEGLNVGYRGFDKLGILPLFPFRYGLSYTTFAFSAVHAPSTINKQQELAAETGKAGANTAGIPISFNLTNTGHRTGADVAQVYLGLPASTGEPPKRLVGFQRVELAPGHTKQVTVILAPRDHPLSYWDTSSHNWAIASGLYTVYVGDSSRNISLVGFFLVP